MITTVYYIGFDGTDKNEYTLIAAIFISLIPAWIGYTKVDNFSSTLKQKFIPLLFDILVFVGSTTKEGFSVVGLFFLFFEVILHSMLIIGLLIKNKKISSIFMVAIKVFDALYFSFIIGQRLDNLYKGIHPQNMFEYINFVSYCLATLLLFTILVFFILNNVTNKHVYWKWMKILIFITIVVMFVCSMFEIANFVRYSTYWFAFLEPFYMVFLLSGILIICHYIEKDN